MTELLRGFFSSSYSRRASHNDFSDFFTKKSSGDQVKIVRKALRDANREQKKVMEEFGKKK